MNRNSWLESEIQFLIENYAESGYSADRMAELLPRHPKSSIQSKAYDLGITNAYAARPWTVEERVVVERCYPDPQYTCKDIAEMLSDRSPRAVRWKAQHLEIGAGFLHGELANAHRLFIRYRKSAKSRDLHFELTETEVLEITSKPCHYCGCPPSREVDEYDKDHPYVYNGIDRMDNSKGYTIDNVVPCCLTCNRAKNQKGYEEFRSWARRLYQHWGQGGARDS